MFTETYIRLTAGRYEMDYRVTVAGFGGQGVLFAGKVIANAAAIMGYEVSWLPSYGPEMRGGTANCRIVISDKPICSPAAERADALIAMNMPSLAKFMDVTDGVIFTDLRFARFCGNDPRVTGIDTGICGGGAAHDGLLNMVMVGALAAGTGIITPAAVRKAIERLAKGDAAARDIAAAEYGAGLPAPKACVS